MILWLCGLTSIYIDLLYFYIILFLIIKLNVLVYLISSIYELINKVGGEDSINTDILALELILSELIKSISNWRSSFNIPSILIFLVSTTTIF